MRRSRTLLLASIAALVCGAGLFYLVRSGAEPSYEGKSLSYWLECLAAIQIRMPGIEPGDAGKAPDAIAALGPEAIPFLLKRLEYRPSRLPDLIGMFTKGPLYQNAYLRESNRRQQAAMTDVAFMIIGTNAAKAAPGLDRILRNSPDTAIRKRAAHALVGLGPEGAEFLGRAVTDRNEEVCIDALSAIRRLGTNVVPILPSIVQCLGHTSPNVVYETAVTLHALSEEAEVFNALLTGEKKVLPLLQKARNHPFPVVSQSCSRFLEHLDLWRRTTGEPLEAR